MRKKLFFIAMLVSIAAAAGAANCVTTRQVSANYTAKQVTFTLTWTGCDDAQQHNKKVWVIVEYRTVNGSTKGAWTRATISGATVTGATYEAGSSSGFYVTGNNGETAWVTATLGNTTNSFDWCAYALDYPPQAIMSNGAYTLKGTPPFTINGFTELGATQKTYSGGCINTVTDKTGHPAGTVINPAFTTGSVSGSSTVAFGGIPIVAATTTAPTGGSGVYSYQWFRNSETTPISYTASFTPPAADAQSVGAVTYTRKVADNTCNTTYIASSGSFVMNVENPCPAPALVAPTNAVQSTIVQVGLTGITGAATYCFNLNSNCTLGSNTNSVGTVTMPASGNATLYANWRDANGCTGSTSTVITSLALGSGSIAGTTCFDINQSNWNTTCDLQTNRNFTATNFASLVAQTYTFTGTGTMNSFRFEVIDPEGVIETYTTNGTGNGATVAIKYKTTLNQESSTPKIYGRTRDEAAKVTINALFHNGSSDAIVTLTASVQDCSCGCSKNSGPGTSALIAGKQWACNNVNTSGTFTNTPDSYGMFYPWDSKTAYATSGTIGNWLGTNSSASSWQAANNPCPSGWSVPAQADYQALHTTGWKWNASPAGMFYGPNASSATWDNFQGCVFFPAVGYR